MMYLIKLIQN